MQEFDFTPRGVCARKIQFTLDDSGETLEELKVVGGCDGNLKALSKVLKGEKVSRIIELLDGNTCGPRPTSCMDQLCKGLKLAQKAIAEKA